MFAPFASFAKRNKNGLQQIFNIIILYIRQYYTIPSFFIKKNKKQNKTKNKNSLIQTTYELYKVLKWKKVYKTNQQLNGNKTFQNVPHESLQL